MLLYRIWFFSPCFNNMKIFRFFTIWKCPFPYHGTLTFALFYTESFPSKSRPFTFALQSFSTLPTSPPSSREVRPGGLCFPTYELALSLWGSPFRRPINVLYKQQAIHCLVQGLLSIKTMVKKISTIHGRDIEFKQFVKPSPDCSHYFLSTLENSLEMSVICDTFFNLVRKQILLLGVGGWGWGIRLYVSTKMKKNHYLINTFSLAINFYFK